MPTSTVRTTKRNKGPAHDSSQDDWQIREMILDALGDIFYAGGTYHVGMAELLDRIRVSRKTFYRTFEGKEGLIVAYLERRKHLAKEELSAIVQGRTGADAVYAVFEKLALRVKNDRFRGCAFLMAAIENPNSLQIQTVAAQNRAFLRHFFQTLTEYRTDNQAIAEQILVLYEGAQAGSAVQGTPEAARTATDVVRLLLEHSPGETPTPSAS